jgi:DNA-binding GntR family transcriptional regulator
VTFQPPVSAPIPRQTFASMVVERIRAGFIDGTLKPGTQLNEVGLARAFGVSRGPVREALQRLIQEGLLHSEPHRGVFVPVMTEDDVMDIYVAREALETAAMIRVIESSRAEPTSSKLDQMVNAMERAANAGDWNTVFNVDLDFHTALVEAAGSPRLDRMFRTVVSETRLCLILLAGVYDARHDLVEEHRRISQHIREERLDQAMSVLKKHYDDAITSLQGRLKADDSSEAS